MNIAGVAVVDPMSAMATAGSQTTVHEIKWKHEGIADRDTCGYRAAVNSREAANTMTALFYRFRLYVAGHSSNSMAAVDNLKVICSENLQGCHEIELVDVLAEPKRALTDGVFLTPTLVKLSPSPERKIVGALSHKASVLSALGISGD